MTRGRSICNVLKTIRKQIADANEIKYEPRECHHQGECRGTCPACEAEVRYIERQLDIRRQLGKAVAIVGISAGLSALYACSDKPKKVDSIDKEDMEGIAMVEPAEHLDGDVEYRSPVDTVIIEKAPKTIKKRTAPFKAPVQKEQECQIMRLPYIIKEPEPPIQGDVPELADVIDTMPSFPGGNEALLAYLSENSTYPEECEEICVQGRVVVTFVVEKDGSISEATVIKSVYPLLDNEALRVVNMPKWIPGMKNGEPVRVKYTIPVFFHLK